jgi:hypothetical protein
MTEAIGRWALAFVLTQVIEVPIYVRGLKARPGAAFGASAITHPVVWWVMPAVWRALYVAMRGVAPGFRLGEVGYFVGYGVVAEGFAVGVEAAWFRVLGYRRAVLWSVVANGASALTGLGLQAVFGWP